MKRAAVLLPLMALSACQSVGAQGPQLTTATYRLKPADESVGAVTSNISNIQALRAFAALAVVFYHTAYLINGMHTDFEGVAVFFVLSGFLMTLITRITDKHFMRDRLVRIVPLYWLMTLVTLIWFNFSIDRPVTLGQLIIATSQGGPSALWHLFCAFSGNIFNLDTARRTALSLLFIPFGWPVLGVGWTLNLEMFYYLVFWCALRVIGRRYAPVAAALLLASLCIISKITPDYFMSNYGGPYTPFFIIGIVAYYIWYAAPTPIISMMHLKIILSSIALSYIILSANVTHFAHFPVIFYGLPLVAVVSALSAHTYNLRIGNRFALLLGDASYALYLSHMLVEQAIANSVPSWLAPDKSFLGAILVVTACSLVAVALHLWIERPMMRGLKKLIRIRSSVKPATLIVPAERYPVT